MNDTPRFDRTLTAWLEGQAPTREPDRLLEAVTTEVAHTRRLPGWVIPERWIPMQTRALFGAIPRTVVILALLALLVASAAAITVGQAPKLPEPFGPAANGLIAYDSEGDIWVADPDSGDTTRLTSGPAIDRLPSWSRDGTRLAYWSQDVEEGPSSLIVVNEDGLEPVTITVYEPGQPDWAMPVSWSPEGGRVVFSYELDCADDAPNVFCDEMHVATTDGSGDVQRIGGRDIYGVNPAWSPDGEMLAFGGRMGDETGLYVMNVDGSDMRLLLPGRLDRFSFFNQTWSPNGERIATQGGGSPNEIWIIEADGSGERNVSNDPGNDTHPIWSPDGAALSWGGSGLAQTTILREGGEPETIGPDRVDGIIWSPDSRMFAGADEDRTLFIFDAASGDVIAEIPTLDRWEDPPSWQRLAP